jgi:hypothetical protein
VFLFLFCGTILFVRCHVCSSPVQSDLAYQD